MKSKIKHTMANLREAKDLLTSKKINRLFSKHRVFTSDQQLF